MSDLHPVALLFVGQDIGSGIRQGRGTVVVRFTCAYTPDPDRPSVTDRDTAATYPVDFGIRAEPGSRTSPGAAGVAEFTLESAWTRGGCGRNLRDSQMLNISIHYDVTATNNAELPRTIRGVILLRSANVAVDDQPTERDERFRLFDVRLLNRSSAEGGG